MCENICLTLFCEMQLLDVNKKKLHIIMNERDRIEMLMKSYNLTPSQFADRTGIQRASVSHILSGRNKPSLEVMLKIYDSFPGMDMKWLMTGVGEEPFVKDLHGESMVENTLFNNISEKSVPQVQPVVPQMNAVRVEPVKPASSTPKQAVFRQPRKPAALRQASVLAGSAVRSIKEIRIYYNDGTYETLFPEKF